MDVNAYREALWALLPPGPAWSRDTPALAAWVNVAAKRLSAVDADVQNLLAEANPYSTLALLPEWEDSLGLPDSCSVGAPTLAERRAAIVARLTDAGGARIPRFVQIAKALGYDGVSTSRFRVHTCESNCEEPLYEEAWRFAWALNIPGDIRITERTCEDSCEDPLRTWGNAELECVMARECPQPSILLITYGAS